MQIRSSPPSTPSTVNTDSDDQIHELFLHSTPKTEPLIEELFNAQMGGSLPFSRVSG